MAPEFLGAKSIDKERLSWNGKYLEVDLCSDEDFRIRSFVNRFYEIVGEGECIEGKYVVIDDSLYVFSGHVTCLMFVDAISKTMGKEGGIGAFKGGRIKSAGDLTFERKGKNIEKRFHGYPGDLFGSLIRADSIRYRKEELSKVFGESFSYLD